jgi:release factor glutamine methyltransferase
VTPQALLNQARQQLAAALGLEATEARIEAQMLLGAALNVSRAWMIAHAEETLTPELIERFFALLQRRLRGEPVAYILGRREFYGLEFNVAPGVLIPRPDTETLVDAALQRISAHSPLRVLDLGTGSGAIAIAIAVHRPQAQVVAVDSSPAALDIARKNAAALGATNLHLLHSDWFSALGQQHFDIILSNPPYISATDPHLAQGDLRFEPSTALASGADGLDDIRRIVATAPEHLTAGGWLLLEHGYDQSGRVAELLKAEGFAEVGHAADLAETERVTFGRKRQD